MATTSPAAPAFPDRVGLGTRAWSLRRERGALAAILVLSGLLEFVRLGQNGYANIYYSAAVKSMLRSWHNFFFISADPNGLITVDKPPLGLWLQALSAKIFGFAPLSLLIPEGICALLAVALLYWIVKPRFGAVAALVSAFALAVFPSFVAVSRDNGVDPLMILLMLSACGAGLAAIDTGRLSRLVLCAVLVGLAFNTKALAGLLCVPGIVVGYALCATGSRRRRLAHLVVAGAVGLVIAGSWTAVVELTPASQRPFVGSTSANSELQLDFGYNGFGRVGGQQGGPDDTRIERAAAQPPLIRPGVDVKRTPALARYDAVHPPVIRHHAVRHHVVRHPHVVVPRGPVRAKGPVPFASDTLSPVRIFGKGLGDQAGWDVPLALFGFVALILVAVRRRRDRGTAGLIVLGGWFAIELLTLDFSKGIVHPYYASALGPGLAAMTGAGAVALAALVRSRSSGRAALGYGLAIVAIAGTVGAQLFLIQRYHAPTWWRIPLVLLAMLAIVAIPFLRRRSSLALGVAVAAVLVAPMVYSFSVWRAPVDGTFPTAGPYDHRGYGGYGVPAVGVRTRRLLLHYLTTHGETKPYGLLTESSDQASPLILIGDGVTTDSDGGYNTTDPALSAAGLARLVAEHRARYLLIGGPYAERGGNGASTAARLVCPEVPDILWAHGASYAGSYLVDCAGRAAELRAPYAFARAFLAKHPTLRYAL